MHAPFFKVRLSLSLEPFSRLSWDSAAGAVFHARMLGQRAMLDRAQWLPTEKL
jgi:hypothetical protein